MIFFRQRRLWPSGICIYMHYYFYYYNLHASIYFIIILSSLFSPLLTANEIIQTWKKIPMFQSSELQISLFVKVQNNFIFLIVWFKTCHIFLISLAFYLMNWMISIDIQFQKQGSTWPCHVNSRAFVPKTQTIWKAESLTGNECMISYATQTTFFGKKLRFSYCSM